MIHDIPKLKVACISAVADLGTYYCDMYRGRQYAGYARCTQTQLHTAGGTKHAAALSGGSE